MPLIQTSPLRAIPPSLEFVRTFGNGNVVFQDVTLDSSGNLYVVGFTSATGAGNNDHYLIKYNSSGVLQWQRVLGGGFSDAGYGVITDSSGNVYVNGSTSSVTGNDGAYLVSKWNSSGTIQWQKYLDLTGLDGGRGIGIDSSNNIYVTGEATAAGTLKDILTVKFNSSGTIQWQRRLAFSGSDIGNGVAVSGSSVYIVGTNSSASGGNIFLGKYNTSGSLQWQRSLGGTGSDEGNGVAVDGSGNIYIVGRAAIGGARCVVAKYNSSGTIQWQRRLDDNAQGNGIATDSSNNVYVVGLTEEGSAFNDNILVAKYNSSGAIQWTRAFGKSGFEQGNGVIADNAGNIYMVGRNNSNPAVIAKLPDDGSGTGTYGVYSYEEISVAEAAAGMTDSAGGMTDNSASWSSTNAGLTAATASLTETTIV